MRRLFLYTLVIILLLTSPAFSLTHTYKGLTGGANANLDGVPVASISDGEIATGADTSNVWRFYYYDASNNNTTNPENSPLVIVPDDNSSGTGAWILVSSISMGPASIPQLPFSDSDAAGAADADKVSCTFYSNLTTVTEDAEYGDFWVECVINGTHTEVLRFDASEEDLRIIKPLSAPQKIIDLDTSGGEVTITATVPDWNGVMFNVTDVTHDVIIPGCNATDCPNKYDCQITLCQGPASDILSIVSEEGNDKFQTRAGTNLTAGYELDSPGGANKTMCATLYCAPDAADGVWQVINETGGTNSISPTWVTGGAPD